MSYVALLAARILTGKNLLPELNSCVIISEGIIVKIIPQKAFDPQHYSGCKVFNLGEQTLLPGMIECHNHVGMDARLNNHLEMMNNSECELTVTAIKTLRDDLYSGVTTARCMGDRHYIDFHLRDEINRGRIEGPHLVCAGIGMRSIHGHGFVGLPHCGSEEFRKTSRENMLRGADLLKIFVTSGTPATEGAFIPNFLTRSEIRTVVEEAAGKNIPVAAHCIGGTALKDCLEEGVHTIEHAYSVTDAEIALLKKHCCTVVLTSGICLDPEREPYLSEKNAQIFRNSRTKATECIGALIKSGVEFVLGSDANHGLLYREVEYAVQLGASRLDALKGITSNAAEVCRVAHKTGCIEIGMNADIIAVANNPLDTQNALKDVRFVMKQGKVYKAEGINSIFSETLAKLG